MLQTTPDKTGGTKTWSIPLASPFAKFEIAKAFPNWIFNNIARREGTALHVHAGKTEVSQVLPICPYLELTIRGW